MWPSSSTWEHRLLPSGMSFTSGNVADNWDRFKQRLHFYFDAMDGELSDDNKIGILMTALGDAGIDIYNSFDLDESSARYEDVVQAFDRYCKPRKNTVFERFVFWQMEQGSRSVDAFVFELRKQARKCEFVKEERDKLIRDQLVVGINCAEVRTQMIRDSQLTLDTATTLAKIWESDTRAAAAAKSMPSTTGVDVSAIRLVSARTDAKCANCGYEHRSPSGKCPAENKECNYCHRVGHFTSVCPKRLSKLNVPVEASPPATEARILSIGVLDCKPECSHVSKVKPVPSYRIDMKAPCADCGSVAENWLCLTCYQIFCSRFVKRHMLLHNGTTNHPIVLSLNDLSMWCYDCNAFVNHSVLDELRDRIAHIKYDR